MNVASHLGVSNFLLCAFCAAAFAMAGLVHPSWANDGQGQAEFDPETYSAQPQRPSQQAVGKAAVEEDMPSLPPRKPTRKSPPKPTTKPKTPEHIVEEIEKTQGEADVAEAALKILKRCPTCAAVLITLEQFFGSGGGEI